MVSDLRITTGDTPSSNHANVSGVDCLLAFDLLVGASDCQPRRRPRRTAPSSSHRPIRSRPARWSPIRSIAAPTAATLAARLAAGQPGARTTATSTPPRLADGLLGSTTTREHPAARRGRPGRCGPGARRRRSSRPSSSTVSPSTTNLAAFRWGRAWRVDPASVERAADLRGSDRPGDRRRTRRAPRRRPRRLPVTLPTPITSAPWSPRPVAPSRRRSPTRRATPIAVARNLHKLMAYKDEYEVARLLLERRGPGRLRGGRGLRTRRSRTTSTRRCCARSASSAS